jgi:hypothetical protein
MPQNFKPKHAVVLAELPEEIAPALVSKFILTARPPRLQHVCFELIECQASLELIAVAARGQHVLACIVTS